MGKGLLDNMIVNDMKNCKLISNHLSVRESRKRFARMKALNRDLRSETGVECTKVVKHCPLFFSLKTDSRTQCFVLH